MCARLKNELRGFAVPGFRPAGFMAASAWRRCVRRSHALWLRWLGARFAPGRLCRRRFSAMLSSRCLVKAGGLVR
jgi:hypothetical protein